MTEAARSSVRRLGKKNKKEEKYDKSCPKTSVIARQANCSYQASMLGAALSATPFAKQMLYNSGAMDDWVAITSHGESIGSITARIPEASDAGGDKKLTIDGMDGDVDFPHGDLKPIATVGEFDICSGEMVVGVPDGLGATLADDSTVRVIVQSESYGPLVYESYPFFVNENAASFTGSHVQYADYDREMLSKFMQSKFPASDAVIGFGELITRAYNLKNEEVGPRNRDGPTLKGAHFSNIDTDGNYVVLNGAPTRADWLLQSLCSAHMEESEQWGEGVGLQDDLFITNEEWMDYPEGTDSIYGIAVHVIDPSTKTMYAVGAMSQGGYEKIVEFNCLHKDYVCFALSGYNGAFDGYDGTEKRNATYGLRDDGEVYVSTKNIVPYRIYIGKKNTMEDGTFDDEDFLARNGLRYGKIYGHAVDMNATNGPTTGVYRDEFHKNVNNGSKVKGKFFPTKWQWNGDVEDFIHDIAWEFQNKPVGAEGTDFEFWNANGKSSSGCKTEHLTPDVRQNRAAFIQSSTCGYFGHFYINNLLSTLDALSGNELPTELDTDYYVYQGTQSIRAQIELGGKGQYASGYEDATWNVDKNGNLVESFKAIDGFEAILAPDDTLHVVIQEDSGNGAGERMFISSALEHDDDGVELTYYFVAMSGGKLNSRMMAGVGIPAGVNAESSAHEFSGVFDLSGLLAKDSHGNNFIVSADDPGYIKRQVEGMVAMNDKSILIGLQAHNFYGGVIKTFQGDRGGQWLVYNPNVSW